MKKLLLPLLLTLFSSTIFSQSTLIRGPYLLIGTPESMTIRWRTSSSEIGKIKYGTDINNLQFQAVENQSKSEHILKVENLQPYTKYYYSLGTDTTFYTPADTNHYFVTSPIPDTKNKFRAWVTGDFGNGSYNQNAVDVKDAFLQNYRDEHTDMWIWLGDNAYESGTDLEFQENVFDIYPEVLRNTVVWATPGNHEYGSINLLNDGPYYDIISSPRNGEAGGVASSNKSFYSFDYGNIHFLSLNSEYLQAIITGNTSFISWLKQDLANTKKDWIVAFWHQPPYTKGTHDSDVDFSRSQLMRENVVPILEEYGVDLVLAGHSHGYERSYLINGHRGKSNTFNASTMLLDGSNGNELEGNEYVKYIDGPDKNKGAVYAVVGCSGKKGSGNNPLNHPVMYISTEDYYGSMVLDVEDLKMNAKFIDRTGAILDEFTIIKENAPLSVKKAEYDNTIDFKVFPNPFKDEFNIKFKLENQENIEILIRDIQGKLIDKVSRKMYEAGEHQLKHFPSSEVSQGIYFVEIRTDNRLEAKRLVRME